MKKFIEKITEFVKMLFIDENGKPSSKRTVGMAAAISLMVALFINVFNQSQVDASLVNAVTMLAFGALGLSSVDKIWGKTNKERGNKFPDESEGGEGA